LIGLAKEISFVRRQNLGGRFELRVRSRVVLQVAVVFGEVIDAEVAKTLPKTPFDDVRRVVREVDPTELVHEIPKEAEFL
jgi:hypothetical protein